MFPKKSGRNKRLGDLWHMLRFANADTILRVVREEYGVTTKTLRAPSGQKTRPFKVALFLLCHDTDLQYYEIAQLLGIEWQFAIVRETREEVISELRRDINEVNKLEGLRRRIYAPAKSPRLIAQSYGINMPKGEARDQQPRVAISFETTDSARTKKKTKPAGSDHPRARNGGPAGRQSRVLERLRSCGQEMSAGALRDMVGIGIMTFAKDMRALMTAGSVVRVGTSRWTRYRAAPDVGKIAPVKEAE